MSGARDRTGTVRVTALKEGGSLGTVGSRLQDRFEEAAMRSSIAASSEALGNRAVQVFERDDRVVSEASSLIRGAERERALEPRLLGRLGDGEDLGIHGDARGRVVGVQRCDHAPFAPHRVREQGWGGIGHCRSRPVPFSLRSTTRAGVVSRLRDNGALDRAGELGHDLAGTPDDQHGRSRHGPGERGDACACLSLPTLMATKPAPAERAPLRTSVTTARSPCAWPTYSGTTATLE